MGTRLESRVLGLVSLGLAVFGIAAPYRWHEIPHYLSNGALVLAVALFAWAIWLPLSVRLKVQGHKLEPSHLVWIGLIGVVCSVLILGAGVIWQQRAVSTNGGPALSVDDPPAGPRTGPIGPILAAQLVDLFKEAPAPCFVKVTAPEDNKNLRETIIWLIREGAKCQMKFESAPKNVDDPPVAPTTESGLVIHYQKDFIFGEKVAHFFQVMSARVAISNRLSTGDDPNLIWLDIGPGSPWK